MSGFPLMIGGGLLSGVGSLLGGANGSRAARRVDDDYQLRTGRRVDDLLRSMYGQAGVDFYNQAASPGGIQPGAPVKIAGVRVGSVDALEFRGARPDPREHHLPEAVCDTAECGGSAPHHDADRNDHASIAAVGVACNGESCERIEQGEGKPGQQPELAIPQTKFVFDIILKQRENLAVHVRQDPYQKE